MHRTGKFAWIYNAPRSEHQYLSYFQGMTAFGPRFGGTMYSAVLFEDRISAVLATKTWPIPAVVLSALVRFTSEEAVEKVV